ncbi:Protein GL2-INTERACTING REPRESSOR 1, partial [Dionaea muscipula]
MSRRNNRQNPQLELKPNQSPSRETSPSSSCVSSEEGLKYSSSPEVMSMVLVGYPRCLMYVILYGSELDPRCPK